MTARFLVTTVATAHLLIAPDAWANGSTFRAWKNYCTPGALRACMSVTVRATQSVTGTSVTLRVRNLQGSNWGIDNSGGYAIGGLWVAYTSPAVSSCPPGEWCGPAGLDEGNPDIGTEGGAVVHGTGLAEWGYDWNVWDSDSDVGPYSTFWGIGSWDKQAGIFGCAVPDFGPPGSGAEYVGGVSTCDGWVTLSFHSFGTLTADDIQIRLTTGGPSDASNWCTFDVASGSNCEVVIPEPITVVLLGTGVAGLGGASLIRRRRKGAEQA